MTDWFWRKVAPTLISVGVLVFVDFFADSAPGIGALIASAPSGLPLSLYLVVEANREDQMQKEGESSDGRLTQAEAVQLFLGTAVRGTLSTLAFVLSAWAVSFRSSSLPLLLACGFTGWGGTLALLHALSVEMRTQGGPGISRTGIKEQ